MGRIVPQDSTALSQVYSAFLAGEDVKAGDIITQASDGSVYWAQDPAHFYAQQRPVFQAADAYAQSWGAPIVFPQESSGDSGVVLQLDDGAFLCAYRTYTPINSTPWSEAVFSIYNKDLTVRAYRVMITKPGTSGGIKTLSAVKLKNGNIMFVLGGTGSFLSFAIYAQDGTQVVGLTQLDVTSPLAGVSIGLLPNGNVAVGYCLNDLKVKLTILSAAGAVVVASLLVDAMPANSINSNFSQTRPVHLAILNDGGFVLANCGGNAQMFTQAGDLNGGKIAFLNNPVGSNAYLNVWAIVLSGGGFVLACDATTQYSVYSPAGALLKTLTFAKNANTQNAGPYWDFVASGDGAFYAFSITSTGSGGTSDPQLFWITCQKVSAAGIVIVQPVTYKLNTAPVGWTNFGWCLRCYVSPDGKVLAATNTAVMILNSSLSFLAERPMLNTVPGAITPAALKICFAVDTVNPNLVSMLAATVSAYTSMGYVAAMQASYLYAPARIPVGIAGTDAPKGSMVSSVIQGPARTRLSIIKPYVVDATSLAGQRLSLLGNAAILKGAM